MTPASTGRQWSRTDPDSGRAMTRQTGPLVVVGLLLAAAGIVWIGQGLGLIPGSFMTGDPFWAAAGGVALVVGVAIAATALRRPRH